MDIDAYLEEEAAKRRAQADRDDADPALQARLQAKRQREFDTNVRNGSITADGEPIEPPEEDDDA